MLAKYKLALTLITVAIVLVAMGRWGIGNQNLRERDVLAIFGAGFFAALAVVRFVQQLGHKPANSAAIAPASDAAATTMTPPPPSDSPSPPPPRSKS